MLTIEPTDAVLGATVRGIDLARPLREPDLGRILLALGKHGAHQLLRLIGFLQELLRRHFTFSPRSGRFRSWRPPSANRPWKNVTSSPAFPASAVWPWVSSLTR